MNSTASQGWGEKIQRCKYENAPLISLFSMLELFVNGRRVCGSSPSLGHSPHSSNKLGLLTPTYFWEIPKNLPVGTSPLIRASTPF